MRPTNASVAPMPADLERRILLLAPTHRDAELTCALLEAYGIPCDACADMSVLLEELADGVGAVMLAEEAVTAGVTGPLAETIAAQPPWSDLPVMLVAAQGADSPAVAFALRTLGNVTLVERPTRVPALVSTVHSALRARDRQYQARSHLEERERTAEVLKQADRRKDEFLAVLAHELRNPLAPIRNSLQILRMTTGADPTAERVCEMMERQVNHMVRLVDDLMEVSRITRGLIELRRAETDLATVIRTAVETSRPLIEAGEHQLAIFLPPERIPLFGDEVRLGQIFANLLNNAAKYTDPGGQIWLTARRDGPEAVVSIRDNGIGLASQTLPVVFDMFMQADRSTHRAQGGLGIGLTLVKTLVELHGGSVSVHSNGPNQGSEFTVRLPLAAGEQRRPDKPGTSERLAGAQRRILVVDDNKDAAVSLGMLLKVLGMDVKTVNDGPAALTTLEGFRPDVVLLDLGMPGMDGFEVARRIREHHEYDDLTLVALTGWGQPEDRERTHAAGFNHHLVKPADISALRSLLAAAK